MFHSSEPSHKHNHEGDPCSRDQDPQVDFVTDSFDHLELEIRLHVHCPSPFPQSKSGRSLTDHKFLAANRDGHVSIVS